MHSSPHRNNSDFQLRHFIANQCHTADVAWCVMYEQKLDIQIKLDATKARLIRRKAKKLEIDNKLNTNDPIQKLNAEADLLEWQSSDGMLEMAILGAEQEICTITQIMDELEPRRKYAHLPLLEAAQAAQQEEWKLEFKHRIENFLLSRGTIPEDQLQAMRSHPDFESELVPHVQEMVHKIANNENKMALLTNNRMLTHG